MSRLAKMLAVKEKERLYLMRHVRVTEKVTEQEFTSNYARRYEIAAIFSATTVVQDFHRGDEMSNGIRICKDQILHEVFGEFVAPLHEAIYAMMDDRQDEARLLIEKVLRGFYNEEEIK